MATQPLSDRLWSKVERRSPSECWPWRGRWNVRGYGRMLVNGHTRQAHRVAWELTNNQPIPAGLEACHSCDNPSCCNPDHIWIGTHRENILDAAAKGRMKGSGKCFYRRPPGPDIRPCDIARRGVHKPTCRRGHPYEGQPKCPSEVNRVRCRICKNAAARARHAKQQGKSA